MAHCDRCNRYFGSYDALWQHERASSRHNMCEDCGVDYWTFEDLREHWVESPGHHYCTFCEDHFDSEYELDDHNDETHQYCDNCNIWLDGPDEMESHDIAVHNLCAQCNRYFTTLNGLKNHLKSSIHVPKTLACPGRGCTKKFSTPANLVLHLETNTCVSGITRQSINRTVARLDRGGLITNPNRMITGTTESYQATQRSWNGYNYECYLCHKEFGTLPGLNQHLASPVHEQNIYHCPKLGTGCNLQFRSLGHLFQHVENGSCGVRRFKVVRDGIDGIMHGMRRIAL
ncbi:C2H2 zinc finger [Ceratobasidium sp. AG-Ba]|nr:C2H2 zinc finger [Ceratobasidium sp. AG-Ba]